MTPAEVARRIERTPGRWADEEQLQEHLYRTLSPLGFDREVVDGADRYDFARDGLIVEVKVAGTPATVLRQLLRYAERPDVAGLVLATTKPTLGEAPQTLGGKPVAVARLWLWGLL
jgi:alkanesulfonate monooxygenase SsuD/methylene tetrahydromethanopterin reductase-like flavin-dependent oxidoreductase (luciferase family)